MSDLQFPEGPERDRIERHLFLVAILLSARTHVIESMSDPASFYGDEHVALVEFLSARATTELGHLIPRTSPFWDEREALTLDELERSLADCERRRQRGTSDDPATFLWGRWAAPAKVIALAVATVARREEVAADLAGLLDSLSRAFQIRADLESLHRDLLAGRPTFAIATVTRAAGIPLQPWPEATSVLGAMAVTGAADTLLESSVALLGECRRAATDLCLPTFVSYVDVVEARLGNHSPGQPLVTISEPTQQQALAMAEGFLLADLSFRESWETHREGMFGDEEVASRFPAGLILEMLSAHVLDLSTQVQAFLSFTAGNGFRYYAHPWSDADSDTVGVFLRLRRYAKDPRANSEELDAVLRCVDRTVAETGGVPVWLPGCVSSTVTRPAVLNLGEACGTVAAHLLLGLISAASDRHRATIETGALHLFDRICDVGLGANVNYPPLFALAAFFRLTTRLEEVRPGSDLARRAQNAQAVLRKELDRAIARRPLTPQQAGLLTIACLDGASADRLDARWKTTILKGQRFDGSWSAEPFAAAPNRGGSVTWYSSTLLTTAICYDALRRTP